MCDSAGSWGGSWAPNDVIDFAPGSFSGSWRRQPTGHAATFHQARLGKGEHQSSMGARLAREVRQCRPLLYGLGNDERQIQRAGRKG